jgi:hypothetical protein
MAKTAVSPDTATNQYFFNLSDNSGPPARLDTQNGGFTVFARVTDMTVVDEIAALGTIDLSSLFPGSPLSAIGAAPIDGNEIVRVEGFHGSGVIHGTVFFDTNGNGLLGAGEGGIADRIVYIDANNDGMRDSSEPTATTNVKGEYHFRVDPGEYTIRLETPESFSLTMMNDRFDVALDLGRSSKNRNFGIRYNGTSWTNPLNETDVDAVNGINPSDVIIIINELNLRSVSNPEDGQLPPKNTSGEKFYDTDSDRFVSPRDAIIVINALPGNNPGSPAGAGESAVEPVGASTIDVSMIEGQPSTPLPISSAQNRSIESRPVHSDMSERLGDVRRTGAPQRSYAHLVMSDSFGSEEGSEEEPQRAADVVFEEWLQFE